MKIAMVTQPAEPFRPPVDGGSSIAILTHQLATRLAERGHDVTAYATAVDAPTPVQVRAQEALGYRVVHFRPLRSINRITVRMHRAARAISRSRTPFVGSALYHPAYGIQVGLDVRRRADEIVHIHNCSQYASTVRAIHARARILLHMHCEWLNQFDRDPILRRLRGIDRVLCCSDYIRGRARSAFPESTDKLHTLYSGVDTDRFGDRPADGSGRDVYSIGRISPEKGVHVLIEAFRRIAREVPEVQLFLVGSLRALRRSYSYEISDDPVFRSGAARFYEGCEIPRYSQLLKEDSARDLEGRVHFLGPISHTCLIERLRSAALVVQPSLWHEPFGMPAAEAMALGLPVVATRAGGLPEIVEHGRTGLIVERDSPDALAAAMLELLRSPERRRELGGAGRRRALERFSFRTLTAQLEQHYRALLDQ